MQYYKVAIMEHLTAINCINPALISCCKYVIYDVSLCRYTLRSALKPLTDDASQSACLDAICALQGVAGS